MLIILKLLIVRTISKIYFIDYSNGFTIEILIDVNICLLWYNIVQKKKTEASSCKDIIGIKQARVSPPIFFFVSEILVHFADSRQSYSWNRQHKPKQQNGI